MAKDIYRVDLAESACDFQPTATEPGLPMLDSIGANDATAASERIVMGTIGCGGQGTGDMRGFAGRGEVQMVAVCDPVPAHRERAKQHNDQRYSSKDCQAYNDFREMLVRDDIDAILCGTPDHWHAQIMIDATMNWAYPPVALPAKKYMDAAKKIWEDELKFPPLTPRKPWHGYELGYWPDKWAEWAHKATDGKYLEVGEEYKKMRTKSSYYDDGVVIEP